MTNVLFDRQTLKVTGLNRPALPFEVEIQNVDPSGLTKMIEVPVIVAKQDDQGNQLYLLPQPDQETDVNVTTTIETTETTDKPVMIENVKKAPLLGADGTQVTYEQTVLGETTTKTDEPVMIDVTTTGADGLETITQEQKKDDQGNLLYWGQVGTGIMIPCFTMEIDNVQKTDDTGALLYYKDVTTVEKQMIPQDPLEITAGDERYTDGLEEATKTQETAQMIAFSDRQGDFTYEDVVAFKQAQTLSQTLKGNCLLFEEMDEATFDTSAQGFAADLGFNFVSLPTGGKVLTKEIKLPSAAQSVVVISESSQPLTISIGASPTDLQPLDSINGRTFDAPIASVYIQFENPNSTRTDLNSFALLF